MSSATSSSKDSTSKETKQWVVLPEWQSRQCTDDQVDDLFEHRPGLAMWLLEEDTPNEDYLGDIQSYATEHLSIRGSAIEKIMGEAQEFLGSSPPAGCMHMVHVDMHDKGDIKLCKITMQHTET